MFQKMSHHRRETALFVLVAAALLLHVTRAEADIDCYEANCPGLSDPKTYICPLEMWENCDFQFTDDCYADESFETGICTKSCSSWDEGPYPTSPCYLYDCYDQINCGMPIH